MHRTSAGVFDLRGKLLPKRILNDCTAKLYWPSSRR